MPLSLRSDLFAQLAVMEGAGMSTDAALAGLRLPAMFYPRLGDTRRRIRNGASVPDAGQGAGLFTELEAHLLRAAFAAGSPERSYRRLSEVHARRAAQIKQVKSQLTMPIATAVLSLCLGPLPDLVAGNIGLFGYLFRAFWPVAAIYAAWRWLASRKSLRSPRLDRWELALPLFGPVAERRNARDYFDSLGLMLDAGLPMLQALPLALASIRNSIMRQRFSVVYPMVDAGARFSEAIGAVNFTGRATAQGLIVAGEAAGKLPETLMRYADMEFIAINDFDSSVAKWLPKIVYGFIAAWMAWSIIKSGAFLPPPDIG